MNPKMRAAVEYGPLGVFFVTFWLFGIFPATAAIVVATVVALSVALVVERRVPKVPLVSGALIVVAGGLTLWLRDETFLKMKPTVLYLMFTTVLLGGLVFGRPLLKPLLGSSWRMDERGWFRLTLRFGLFFILMAGLNELVWRTQTTGFWVNYKMFGTIGLMLAFTASQIPLITRHQLPDEEEADKPEDQ
jgi:intracellular septation protein